MLSTNRKASFGYFNGHSVTCSVAMYNFGYVMMMHIFRKIRATKLGGFA